MYSVQWNSSFSREEAEPQLSGPIFLLLTVAGVQSVVLARTSVSANLARNVQQSVVHHHPANFLSTVQLNDDFLQLN